MKSLAKITLAIFAFSVFATTNAQAQNAPKWEIDNAHASVNFSINHFFSAVTGKFKTFSGDFHFDPENLKGSTFNFTVKVKSVDTDDAKRDNHLQSDDFFDAEKYPEMNFVSTKIEKVNDKQYILHGNLTIKDVTKKVAIPMTITGKMDNPWKEGSVIMGIKINTTIDRTEYGVGTGNWAATAVVGDEVAINISMELDGKK